MQCADTLTWIFSMLSYMICMSTPIPPSLPLLLYSYMLAHPRNKYHQKFKYLDIIMTILTSVGIYTCYDIDGAVVFNQIIKKLIDNINRFAAKENIVI